MVVPDVVRTISIEADNYKEELATLLLFINEASVTFLLNECSLFFFQSKSLGHLHCSNKLWDVPNTVKAKERLFYQIYFYHQISLLQICSLCQKLVSRLARFAKYYSHVLQWGVLARWKPDAYGEGSKYLEVELAFCFSWSCPMENFLAIYKYSCSYCISCILP